MVIEYYIKNVYGNNNMYVSDPKIASEISMLTGTKTLMPVHIEALTGLGFSFEEVLAPKN